MILKHQFVAVINKKIPVGRALNALGHMSAGLSALFANEQNLDMLRFDNYSDADQNPHKYISDCGFIVLKAENSNKIRSLRENLIQKNIKFVDFVETMTIGSYLEQQEATSKLKESELEYFGICFFHEIQESKELTKKFSLYQ